MPPKITKVTTSASSITLVWTLSDTPKYLQIQVNASVVADQLAPSVTSYEITTVNGLQLQPDTDYSCAVCSGYVNTGLECSTPTNVRTPGQAPPGTPPPPQVNVQSIEPATLQHPNQIIIAWSSFSYTDGNVLWGPLTSPQANRYSFQPGHSGNQPDYTGQYAANIPQDLAGELLSFMVEVENKITNPGLWARSTVIVRATENYHSLRPFLLGSNVSLPTGIRQYLHATNALRALMQA